MRLSPRRGVDSSPEQELLGAFTSHGPSRGLYTPARPSRVRRTTEAAGVPAANPPLSVERMRAAVSPAAGATTVLQPGVPAGSAGVVAMEGPAEIPGDGGGQRETQRAEPAVPGARSKPQTSNAERSASADREGNQSRFFSTTIAIAPAATRALLSNGDHPPSGSVRARAGAPWNASGNASGAGGVPCSSSGTGEPAPLQISLTY